MSNELIDLDDVQPAERGMIDVAQTRQAQEVQAAMVIAKKFPRDETAAINRIIQSCKRMRLAEVAMYEYPKGGQKITGPSIRLAEAMAQAWGNIDFGIVELEQRDGESIVMSYAWDLETNSRQQKVFNVSHAIKTRNGMKHLDDPRDIYEITANQGARRLRACILGIIPGDVQDLAVEQCQKTLQGGDEPLIDRIRKMVAAFSELGVNQKMLEARLGHSIDACSVNQVVQLRRIYQSIKDGVGAREDFFDVTDEPSSERPAKNKRVRESKVDLSTPNGVENHIVDPSQWRELDLPEESLSAIDRAVQVGDEVRVKEICSDGMKHNPQMEAEFQTACDSAVAEIRGKAKQKQLI